MKALHSSFFFFLFIFSIFLLPLSFAIPSVAKDYRRILHEPLFQGTSTPPSDFQSPPSTPVTPDQPFFPEVPSTPYQSQSSPSPPSPSSAAANDGLPISTDNQSGKPGRKVAIAISVGIVTLGMLSALAFYLYRHKMKHTSETQKLVNGGVDGGSQRFQEDVRPPSSSFLYIGTVEPSRESASESNGGSNGAVNASPYRKLNSIKRSDRYRPSPELQPLPPLSRPPPSANSPSAYSPSPSHSSSDEESRGTAFYTPHGSTISSDAGYYTPFARPLNNNDHSVGSVIHSKKNSPRFTTGGAAVGKAVSSSPEMKHVIIPSIKQKSPLQPTSQQEPQNNRQELPYSSNGPKFSPPPPPQNMAALQAIYQDKPPHITQAPPSPPPFPPRAAPPPPPPPPPPPLQKRREDFQLNVSGSEVTTSSTSNELLKKPELRTPSPKSKHVEEVNSKSVGSSVKTKDTETDSGRPKLKPLHWDKVRASSDRATVWDQLKSSSFPLNEDRMEHLFGCNSTNSAPRETVRRSVLPPVENENRVLDPKKSQNIAILLRALNVTTEEVSETLLDGNTESLGAELLETLVKMAPTKEEEIKLRDYSGDASKLGTAEKFLKTILDIPFAFKRVEAMLYRANFDAEVKYLRNSFQTLEDASKELKNSRLFLKLLEAVLRTGNRMNVGTNRGDATAFKLDTLLKLVDVKGTDGKTTLLHFVVQEITISEVMPTDSTSESLQSKEVHLKEEHFRKKGLQLVAGLSKDLSNVKRAAGMDFDVLSSYVSKLETGLEKVRSVIQLEKIGTKQGKFFDSMKKFLKEAEEESCKVKGDERMALSLVKEVTEYFHGDAAKEEAHPLRIFTVVRDFLGILDNVCKEVKSIQDRTVMGSARSSLPVLNRYNVRQDRCSDP